jgi:hypothetical protein
VNTPNSVLSFNTDDAIARVRQENDRLKVENARMVIQINTYRADIERLRRDNHARQVMIDELRKGYGY